MKSTGERIMYIICIIIAMMLVTFIATGNIKIIIIVGDKVDGILRNVNWKQALHIIQYLAL